MIGRSLTSSILHQPAGEHFEQQHAQAVVDAGKRRLTTLLAFSGLALFVMGGIVTTLEFLLNKQSIVGPMLPFTFILGIASLIVVLMLVRRGRTVASSYLLIASYTVVVSAGALFGVRGGPQESWPGLAFFYLITLWAGLLIGPRIALLVATWGASMYYLVAAFLAVPTTPQSHGFLGLPDYFLTRAGQIDVRGLSVLYGIVLATWIFGLTVQALTRGLSERALELRTTLHQLEQSGEDQRQVGQAILEVMHRLRGIVSTQGGAVQEQVSALSEITTTVEELSAAALQIASRADEVKDASEQALAATGKSQDAVQRSVMAMMQIRAQVQQIVERILKLNESIVRIGDVNNAVSNIAAQTHLLALNAAIEAAGAGQAGERFATVAAEVKKLAGNSQQEATKIGDLIAAVSRANAASVMATEQGLKDADSGTSQARAAGDANLEVIDTVGNTASLAQTIRITTAQQRSASAQVVETMRHLRDAASGIADTTEDIDNTVSELAALATQLGVHSTEGALQLPIP